MSTFYFYLPFFPGFYESALENSDTLYQEVVYDDYYKETYGSDDVDDYELDEDYHTDCCKAFCESFLSHCPEFVENIEFNKLVSPKYYNYSTDKLDAKVTLKEGWREELKKFLVENKDSMKEQIHKDWSSCDGFWSFLSNDYEDWLSELDKSDDDIDERIVSSLIAYMMVHNHHSGKVDELSWDILYPVLEDVYLGEYIRYIGQVKVAE